MKKHKIIYLLLPAIFLFFAQSCKKDQLTEPEPVQNKYLVKQSFIKSYPTGYFSSSFGFLSLLYPEYQQEIDNAVEASVSDVKVYKIEYKTKYKGEEKIASGIICIPPNASGEIHILSFQNGTNTLNTNAASENNTDTQFQMLHGIASMGFVVVISDYLGFGSSNDIIHPYFHEESTYNAVIDLIKAGKEMLSQDFKNINVSNDIFLLGYSQGGYSTMVVHNELEKRNDPDLQVKASVCGAGFYDLIEAKNSILERETYDKPYYLAYLAESYRSVGLMQDQLSKIFNEPYASLIPDFFDGNHSSGDINSQLADTVSQLLTTNFIENFDTAPEFANFKAALTDNSVSAWSSKSLIKLYHGTSDTDVFPSASENIYQDFLTDGVPADNIELILLQGRDHSTAVTPTILSGLDWFLSIK